MNEWLYQIPKTYNWPRLNHEKLENMNKLMASKEILTELIFKTVGLKVKTQAKYNNVFF